MTTRDIRTYRLGLVFLAAMTSATLVGGITLPREARAEDIDLFLSNSGEQYAPNLYVMVDNSANWSATIGGTTKKKMEHDALHSVFTDPAIAGDGTDSDPIQLRLGFGLFSDSNSPRGGKVWEHVEDLTYTFQDNVIGPMLYDADGNMQLPKANNLPYALSLNEAYAYFAGEAPVAGMEDGDHDKDAITTSSDNTAVYDSPAAGNCGKNYAVVIGNGEPDSGEDNDAEAKLAARGGKLAGDPIDIDPSNFESNWSDEYARLMAGTDVVPDSIRDGHEQNVRTYVIDVYDPDQNETRKFNAARAWMKSIAARGDGLYFAAHSTADIKAALDKILDEMFAVNDVFAASTLPVSVNVRGTNLNQVYMGVFRPDEMDRTRWQGNLKLYQLAVDEETNTLFLADKNGDGAQSPSTGFIRNTALSFWTHDSTYWSFDPRGTPESGSDAPDGEVVEKGGAHQRLRDKYPSDPEANRTLYTSTATDCAESGCALEDFDVNHSAVDQFSLNTADSTEASNLVAWMHGENNVDDTNDPDSQSSAAIRPSVHGDVLHSQPAVVNYGDIKDNDGVADVYAYYGANDGIFHALRGGKADSSGNEVWGFIPEEFFGRLKALRDLADGKEYFADGAVGVYKNDSNGDGVIRKSDGDEVHLFISMRRGGRLLYALDVTAPESPEFLWKIDSSQTGFGELGQSWSRPEISQVHYDGDGDGAAETHDVLVFGGGYDPETDDRSETTTTTDTDADGDGKARDMGRALYVVDAETGEPIWQAGPNPQGANVNVSVTDMSYSLPSDVTVIDRDGNGYHDRLYVGDTGGQVWRADISGHPSSWAVYKLASDGDSEALADRRFLYSPDVVYGEDANGRYDAVLVGSGARTHPFRRSVTNRFYMFKDRHTGESADPSTWQTILATSLYDATNDGGSVNETALADADGWYIDLLNEEGNAVGEKVVSSAVTLGGTTFFSTNEPPPESSTADDCTKSLGTARNYEISYEDGTAANEENDERFSEAVGGGFPPSPVPVIVEINNQKYEVVLSGTDASAPPGTSMGRRNPVYWNGRID